MKYIALIKLEMWNKDKLKQKSDFQNLLVSSYF
jgi:hypothetical protein